MTDSQMDTPKTEDAALAAFMDYFRKNYPGPDTIIGRPDWHSPKIFRAARHALFTPTVLAADPAVKALIAAERERCAGECDRTAREADMFGDKHGRQISERTAAAIRGEKP